MTLEKCSDAMTEVLKFENPNGYMDILEKIKELKNENEKLKNKVEEMEEDLEDYKVFCDAFDVDCARDAIRIHWKNISEGCQEDMKKKGYAPSGEQ